MSPGGRDYGHAAANHEMEFELEQYHKSNAALDLMIGELLKIEGMEREIAEQRAKWGARALESTAHPRVRAAYGHQTV